MRKVSTTRGIPTVAVLALGKAPGHRFQTRFRVGSPRKGSDTSLGPPTRGVTPVGTHARACGVPALGSRSFCPGRVLLQGAGRGGGIWTYI